MNHSDNPQRAASAIARRIGAGMTTVSTVADLRANIDAARTSGMSIGLVPTMGALHEGHLSLIEHSSVECDFTVVSIFVNPTQFRPGEDLSTYPRQLLQDSKLAEAHGCDILFTPTVDDVYPDGFATSVAIRGITETLCGDPTRRGHEHFDGVATVVAKLFNMTGADRAYFGQKDAQQVAVIKHLVRDLDFRVEVITCPTVREADGLAMSSRNAYLDDSERRRALALFAALDRAREVVSSGVGDANAVKTAALATLSPHVDCVEYFELVDPDTLKPVSVVDRPTLAVVAAHVGATRLIDNAVIQPAPAVAGTAIPAHDFPLVASYTSQNHPPKNTQGAAL